MFSCLRVARSIWAAAAIVFMGFIGLMLCGQLAGCQPAPEQADCTDPLGCIEIGPGEAMYIAALQALSGGAQRFGVDQLRGIELALENRGQILLGHPIVLCFVARSRKGYQQDPQSPYHAHVYDAAGMLFQAIEQAAGLREDGWLRIGRQALRRELSKLRNFQGVTGRLSCNKHGDCGTSQFTAVRLDGSHADLGSLRNNALFTYQPKLE